MRGIGQKPGSEARSARCAAADLLRPNGNTRPAPAQRARSPRANRRTTPAASPTAPTSRRAPMAGTGPCIWRAMTGRRTRRLSARTLPTPGVFSTSSATSGNGLPTAMARISPVHRRTAAHSSCPESQARHPRRRLALPCELSAGRQSRWQPGRHPRQRSGISPGTLVPVNHIGLPASWPCTEHHQPDNCRRAKSVAGKSRPTTTLVNAPPRGKRMRMDEWSRTRINRLSILLPAIRQTSISIWSISIFFLDLRNCLH